jgi:hypothetical protein
MKKIKKVGWWSALLALALSTIALSTLALAQDNDNDNDQDDPPSRVARLGYMEGSVSFQPAGEDAWVQAVPNRPMTTGDKLWSDKDSRAEVQLGSSTIRLSENTGFSFLNLDDNTVQIQLTSGSLNIRVRRLDDNNDYEVDTPNLAFSVSQPGSYRIEASDDGTYTVVGIRDGGGQATGNGQTYTLHSGQQTTFSGTDSLNADVVQIGDPDPFDTWSYNRDNRFEHSRSAQYLAPDVVGYEDLDDNGDWRDDPSYGHVWFPNSVEVGWAPYHTGHWDWIAPWGYTWVDDSAWGYAPFHYGRWVTVGGRWGWVAGPVAVRAVYAPALVVFVGGGVGVGFGGNVGWFPLGPREVFVPSYHVSERYVERVNISNTTVTNVQVTNIYRTTIVNNSTTITNVTYANRNVQGAVMVVPQHAFASAQPLAHAAVAVNAQQIASASVSARVAVVPTHEAVLGARASTASHVAAPPAAVMNRQVVAKKAPPAPPVSFAKQQQALAAHPGQPLARSEVRTLAPAATANAHPMVKQAPPGKPATAAPGRPGNQPGNQPSAARPGQPGAPTNNQPTNNQMNRPGNQPPARNDRPPSAQPNNRPEANTPPAQTPNNRPAQPPANRTTEEEQNRPTPNNRPEPNNNQPPARPATNDRPAATQPNNRPEAERPAPARPEPTQPEANRPPQRTPAPETRQAPPPRQQPKAQTPAEKKKEEDQRKKDEKPPKN